MPSKLRSALFGLALLLPSLVFLVAFTAWPLVQTVINSLYKQNLAVRVPRFVGLQQFADLLSDKDFLRVLGNTVTLTVVIVPISVALAFVIAVLLNRKLAGIGIFRGALFYPTILPLVSAATIWLLLYNVDFGLVNSLIKGFGGKAQNFLGTSELVLPALCVMLIWKNAGFLMVFYLAGLQGLPGDVMEAAKLDGASTWQTLRHVTLPLLRGTTIFVVTIAVTNAFQTVDQLYAMTQGGPNNASNLLLFNIFETNFRFQDSGSAYAQTVILLVALLIFTIANTVIADRRSFDAN